MSTNNHPLITGEVIQLRVLKGIKQITAAKKLGITQQAYSKIELSGVISPDKISILLFALNCNPQDVQKILAFLPPHL